MPKKCPECNEEKIDDDETMCGYCFDVEIEMEEEENKEVLFNV